MKQGSKRGMPLIGLAAFCVSIIGLGAYAQTPSAKPEEGRVDRLIEQMGKDGVITREDALGPLKDHFDEIDTNKDSKLVKDELEAFHKDHHPPEGDCRGRMMFVRHKEDHKNGEKERPKDMKPRIELDANKDRKITLDEFLSPHKQVFARLDANHDGVLEGNEIPHMPPPGMCGRDGLPPPPPPH